MALSDGTKPPPPPAGSNNNGGGGRTVTVGLGGGTPFGGSMSDSQVDQKKALETAKGGCPNPPCASVDIPAGTRSKTLVGAQRGGAMPPALLGVELSEVGYAGAGFAVGYVAASFFGLGSPLMTGALGAAAGYGGALLLTPEE